MRERPKPYVDTIKAGPIAMSDEISMNEAAARGIARLRKPVWSDPFDHIKIDIFEGKPGPWMHLYAPFNKECNGRDPVDIVWVIQFGKEAADSREFVPYDGPLPDSDAYKARQAQFDGVLSAERTG